MRTPKCPLTLQRLSPLPIPYSPPTLGFGNQVRSAVTLGISPGGMAGTEGSPRECGASRFYSGRDAKAEHSCGNRGFPHEHPAVPLPLPLADCCRESRERLHIPLPHSSLPSNNHNLKCSGLWLREHCCDTH